MSVIYSFTNRTYSVVRGVMALALGICLLVWPDSAAALIIKIIAAFLLAAGILTLMVALNARRKTAGEGMPALTIMNICVYLVFGLLIFMFPNFFLGVIMFLFGAVLLFFGTGQLINVIYSKKYIGISWGFYVVPVLMIASGILLFFNPFSTVTVLTAFFGACLAVYGLSEMYSAWRLKKVVFDKSGKYVGIAEDVPYEEVGGEEK